MIRLILHRIKKSDKCIQGKQEVWLYDRWFPLQVLFECATLELPWLDNKPFISCIPAKIYKCKVIIRPNGDEAILIMNVPDRENILEHYGNFTIDIEGCVLVGETHVDINGDGIMDVTNSKKTMAKLLGYLPRNTIFELEII